MNRTFKRRTVNGHQYQLLTLPGTDLFKFEIVNKYGSNIERVLAKTIEKDLYGISHFIEHLGFRNPKDYTTEELMVAIKSEGSYNASTDHDRINYWFKTVSDRAALAVKLVCNYALNDLRNINEEEFNIEKKVVFNEAKRYLDDQQTMFHFNMTGAVCCYHPHDNVLGIPDAIDQFTIEDAILVKDIFLSCANSINNITYDPDVLTEDQVIEIVEAELARHNTNGTLSFESSNTYMNDYINNLNDPVALSTVIPSDTEQFMTGIVMDVIDDVMVARRGNGYLSQYSKTSLNDLIREKNGLTYGISFYDTNISYMPYTMFACDVTKGTEELMMELFVEAINTSADNFDVAAFDRLTSVTQLKRSMGLVNQENYGSWHWTSIWFPDIIDAYEDVLSENIDSVYTKIDEDITHQRILTYLQRVKEVVNTKDYSYVTNSDD